MSAREEWLNQFKSMPFGNELASSLPEEKFQNQTLRPILKWQNELLLEVFRNYASKQKGVFFSLSPEKKEAYIENVIQKDIKFRNTIKGIVIGLFSLEEFQDYIKNSSNLNKRMMNLVIERLKSQSMVI
ncbi:glyoxalase [Flavobacterium nakdongensis]